MTTDREAFLAGQSPEDVHIYLSEERVTNLSALEAHGERVEGGLVLVLPGEKARSVFQQATGIDPMGFAQEAMGTDGEIDDACTSGTCPECGASPELIFAFAEEQNEEVGGLYAEGPVIHAYAACECGERYSEKWVATA